MKVEAQSESEVQWVVGRRVVFVTCENDYALVQIKSSCLIFAVTSEKVYEFIKAELAD